MILRSLYFFVVQGVLLFSKPDDIFWKNKSCLTKQSFNNVKVALLDTDFSICDFDRDISTSNLAKLNTSCGNRSNLKLVETLPKGVSLVDRGENHLSEAMKEKCFFQKTTKKILHADLMCFLIQSIAPDAQIISIPIMNQQGRCSKLELLEGLRKAAQLNVDILCLALKINNFDCKNNIIDQEILHYLSMFPFVVFAAGNDGCKVNNNSLCALPIFFIGSTECTKNNQIKPCKFTSFYEKNMFYLQSSDMQLQSLIAQGTSAAAALFTKSLAHFLLNSSKKISAKKMHKLLKKNAQKITDGKRILYILDAEKTLQKS